MIQLAGWHLTPSQLVIAVMGNDVELTWTATGAPSYQVYKSQSAVGDFDTLVGTTADTSLVIPGAIQLGVRTYYRVFSRTAP